MWPPAYKRRMSMAISDSKNLASGRDQNDAVSGKASSSNLHRRQSPRLLHYDYAKRGAYFVTICAHNNLCLFGSIEAEEMRLNDAGRMIEGWFIELQSKFPLVDIDTHVIMPNHKHGIVIIEIEGNGRPHRGAPTLETILDWFKTMTTNAYIRGVKSRGWPPLHKRSWQRSYFDRIVRNEAELN